MTDEERAREAWELALIKAQVSLAVKQTKTEVWKVVIGAAAAGAVVGGLLVEMIRGGIAL